MVAGCIIKEPFVQDNRVHTLSPTNCDLFDTSFCPQVHSRVVGKFNLCETFKLCD